MTLTLYAEPYFMSPYVMSVFVALREKGLPFAIELVDVFAGGQQAPEFRARSLTARVPVLEHDGFFLSESSAIAEYLDETFPAPKYAPLYPSERQARARARQLQAFLRSDLAALREDRPTSTIFYAPVRSPLSAAAQRDTEKLLRVAEALVPASSGPLFGAFSIADADLTLMLQRLIANGEPVSDRLLTYAQAHWSRPSVAEFVHHARPARS